MIGSRLGNRVLVFFVEKGVPQMILLEDEVKQIIEINQRTVKTHLRCLRLVYAVKSCFSLFYLCEIFSTCVK